MSRRNVDITVREASWGEDGPALSRLRGQVFIDEQGVPRDIEWDGRDDSAWHVIAERDGTAIGCGRLLPEGRIGRLAVAIGHRRQGLGKRLLNALLALARREGLASVYLHAQVDALPFYERSGFAASGDTFFEAGIAHRNMTLSLDYERWMKPLPRVGYPQPFAQLVTAQAHACRRELAILSPQLDRRVFDNEALAAALRRFIREHRQSRVRIVLRDLRAVVEYGHGLLNLARRLPSSMEIRVLEEHPEWNDATLVIGDRNSLLVHPGEEENPGAYLPDDRARSEAALTRFETLWEAASAHPELRSLSL